MKHAFVKQSENDINYLSNLHYQNARSRNLTIDFIRGVAILLVVLGHNIQYGSGDIFYKSAGYFDNSLFKLIYSFHMPLFALLSGYLFFWTMKKSVNNVLKRRVLSLILPIFCWVSLEYVVKCVVLASKNGFCVLSLFSKYVFSFFHEFWFLWAIFWCSVVVLCIESISFKGGGMF